MGFRSTFTTSDYSIEWPAWFREKYAESVWLPEKWGPLSSRIEAKTYGAFCDLPKDIQTAIDWERHDKLGSFILVYLHECGGITRVQIEREAIRWTEPASWAATDGVEHDYCYRCSDAGGTLKRWNDN